MFRWLIALAIVPVAAHARTTVVFPPQPAAEPEVSAATNVPRLHIGAPRDATVTGVRIVLTSDDISRTARLVFTVATTSTRAHAVTLPVTLPPGAHVTGGALTLGYDERVVAHLDDKDWTRQMFDQNVLRGRDPLLVELASETDRDVLAVSAFPLDATHPARVELVIDLPVELTRLQITTAQRIAAIGVETDQVRRVRATRPRDGGAAFTFGLPPVRAMPVGVGIVAPIRRLTTKRSLYAGWARWDPSPVVTLGPIESSPAEGVGRRDIRRTVKQHMAQLSRCYTAVTEYRGGQEGTAVLHFTIDAAGAVTESSADGEIDDPRILSCLAAIPKRWTFTPGDMTTLVNYPLTFTLAD